MNADVIHSSPVWLGLARTSTSGEVTTDDPAMIFLHVTGLADGSWSKSTLAITREQLVGMSEEWRWFVKGHDLCCGAAVTHPGGVRIDNRWRDQTARMKSFVATVAQKHVSITVYKIADFALGVFVRVGQRGSDGRIDVRKVAGSTVGHVFRVFPATFADENEGSVRFCLDYPIDILLHRGIK